MESIAARRDCISHVQMTFAVMPVIDAGKPSRDTEQWRHTYVIFTGVASYRARAPPLDF